MCLSCFLCSGHYFVFNGYSCYYVVHLFFVEFHIILCINAVTLGFVWHCLYIREAVLNLNPWVFVLGCPLDEQALDRRE